MKHTNNGTPPRRPSFCRRRSTNIISVVNRLRRWNHTVLLAEDALVPGRTCLAPCLLTGSSTSSRFPRHRLSTSVPIVRRTGGFGRRLSLCFTASAICCDRVPPGTLSGKPQVLLQSPSLCVPAFVAHLRSAQPKVRPRPTPAENQPGCQ